nr:patatin-like phospholipase family protein [Antrihabitans stalactiti]
MVTTRALVVGAGGATGLAWSSATLAVLEAESGWDPRDADVFVGTSQGSLLVALLASGIGTADLTAWYRRELPVTHPLRHKPDARQRNSGSRVPLPAAPGMAIRALLRPGRVATTTALSGLLPAGRSSLDTWVAPLTALWKPDEWVAHPATWAVAVDYDSGERVSFGAPGAPEAGIIDAVRASSSVPGVCEPTRIGDRRYIDGGVHSSTSADLVASLDVDEVIVLAPMAGEGGPSSPTAVPEFVMRKGMQRKLAAEVRVLRKAGKHARVLVPSPYDVAAMGGNSLDPKNRRAIFESTLKRGHDRIAATGGSK